MTAFLSALLLLSLPEAPRLAAQRAAAPVVIDGRLDEAAWVAAPASDAFTQRMPNEGQAPSERTSVRVLYDAEAIYVGVLCEQRGVPLRPRLTRRDRVSEDADRVTVAISSRGDRASAFQFAVNAAGVLSDGLFFDDTTFDSAWDENWDAATAIIEGGWSAEFRIPLRVLRFETRPAQEWGFNVHRLIAGRQETDDWAYVPRTQAGYVSRLGRLENLVGLEPPHAEIELRPFTVLKVGRQDAALGRVRGASAAGVERSWQSPGGGAMGMGASVGLDARWHLTRDLTLDGTLYPDFGQVEADQLVLNLTAYETFFPEKRPFFLEGFDIFRTPIAVLYTRRIGTAPGLPALPAGESALEAPGPSSIPAAVKLAGRLGDRVSVGLLSAVTSANEVRVRDAGGGERWRLAAVPTTFNALRVKAGVGAKGHLGAIVSAVNRFERPALFPAAADGTVACPGATTARIGARCFRDAYVAALDGRWRSPAGDYSVNGQAVGSLLVGGQPSVLRDGTTRGPGRAGSGVFFNAAKDGGRHFLFETYGGVFSRGLELNDAGYLDRHNQAGLTASIFWVNKQPWGPTLESSTSVEWRHWRNTDGVILFNFGQLTTRWLLRNQWRFSSLVQYRLPSFEDREVGDGTAIEHAGMFGYELTVSGDPRRVVSGELSGKVYRRTNGSWAELAGGIAARGLGRLELELLPSLSYTQGEPRFIEEQGAGSLLFGRLDAAQVGATLRLTWAFTPRLTLQGYSQLFLARGRYSDLSTFNRPAGTRPAIRLTDLVGTHAVPGQRPDFERAGLNASLLLRWEYRLGSTLYLVYTRSQAPDVILQPDERPTLDLRALPRAPAADVLLLKLTVWWG
jgi:hypothetical protein